MKIVLPILAAAVGGCVAEHRFEVDAGEAQADRAELVLYDEKTVMERSGHLFTARRPDRSDGSGRIEIFYRDRAPVFCSIGYVTSRDPEPHRFAVRDGACVSS